MTRNQCYLKLAYERVSEIKDGKVKVDVGVYGGLCHQFPILVRSAGLCQALAFYQERASKNDARAAAYARALGDVAKVFGIAEGEPNKRWGPLLETIQGCGVRDYLIYTKTVQQAWVYFKRFAASLLDADPSARDEVAP